MAFFSVVLLTKCVGLVPQPFLNDDYGRKVRPAVVQFIQIGSAGWQGFLIVFDNRAVVQATTYKTLRHQALHEQLEAWASQQRSQK